MTRVNVGVRAEMKEDVGGEEAASIDFVKLWANKRGAGRQLNRTISKFQLNWPLTLENTFPFFIQSIRSARWQIIRWTLDVMLRFSAQSVRERTVMSLHFRKSP